MEKLLVITDPHLCPHGERIIGLDPTERLQTVLDHALAHHSDARALIFMGDLAHQGDLESYRTLKMMVAAPPFPVTFMLGNHDHRANFCAVFEGVIPDQDGYIQSVIDLPNHRLITLDTLDGPPYPKGHHAGRLCDARLAWLDDALETANGRMPVVLSHHPPLDTGIFGMDLIKLADGKALLSRLKTHKAHLLFGHMHRFFAGSVDGVPWTCFKSPCHQGPLDLINPDSSLSINEPGGYGVILLPVGGVIAHMQDVGIWTDVHRDAASTS